MRSSLRSGIETASDRFGTADDHGQVGGRRKTLNLENLHDFDGTVNKPVAEHHGEVPGRRPPATDLVLENKRLQDELFETKNELIKVKSELFRCNEGRMSDERIRNNDQIDRLSSNLGSKDIVSSAQRPYKYKYKYKTGEVKRKLQPMDKAHAKKIDNFEEEANADLKRSKERLQFEYDKVILELENSERAYNEMVTQNNNLSSENGRLQNELTQYTTDLDKVKCNTRPIAITTTRRGYSLKSKKDMSMVVAIDFGTTYSGYAFSSKDDYNRDPTKILINECWTGYGTAIKSYKAPSVVLFDKNKTFKSFGYEAEMDYSELALDNEHHDCYYFSRFKMRLHNGEVHREMELQDDEGKTLPAIEVFCKVIWYLKTHLIKKLLKWRSDVDNEDIHWIITVPAIWTDSAKQFMREAACKADIAGSKLTIALEPEAASLYCQYLSKTKLHGESKFDIESTGSKYMVIDLGGCTADITVHERQTDGNLKELCKASGVALGGNKVDEEFKKMLIKVFGGPVLDKFRNNHRAEYMFLMRELEMKKRLIKPETSGKITIKVSHELSEMYSEETGESTEDAIKRSPFAGKLNYINDRMRLDATIYKGFFIDCIDKIVHHIRDILGKPEVKGTNLLFMVGGFSESEMMQDALQKAFKKCTVFIPDDAGFCVMKGAVIFGHRPEAITYRVSRYTFGISISPPFDPSFYPESHKVMVGGREFCHNVFLLCILKGESFRVGEERSGGRHVTLHSHQKEMLLNIYASSKERPQFVDEKEVEFLGQIKVPLSDSNELIAVEVKWIFGETELRVDAREIRPNVGENTYSAFFDY